MASSYGRRLVGSVVFLVWLTLVTVAFSLLAIPLFPLPARIRHRIIGHWNACVLHGARILCGIDWKAIGLERLPKPPFVILSNHQSAWETLGFHLVFPSPLVYVMKRQLLLIPFFGWGVAAMSPIAIARSRQRKALAKLARQGEDRIAKGFSIVIFPEGTRMQVGCPGDYAPGGAWLAKRLGIAVVPVAVNSGMCWPRNAWVKSAGCVTVSIGEAIETGDKPAKEINETARTWIQGEQERLEGVSA